MKRTWIAAAITSLMLSPAAHAQDVDLVGCYDVILGDWAPSLSSNSDANYYAPPRRIELMDTTARWFARPMPGRNAAAPAPGVMPSVHRVAFWSTRALDSVEVILSTGFGGVRMQLFSAASARTVSASAKFASMFSASRRGFCRRQSLGSRSSRERIAAATYQTSDPRTV